MDDSYRWHKFEETVNTVQEIEGFYQGSAIGEWYNEDPQVEEGSAADCDGGTNTWDCTADGQGRIPVTLIPRAKGSATGKHAHWQNPPTAAPMTGNKSNITRYPAPKRLMSQGGDKNRPFPKASGRLIPPTASTSANHPLREPMIVHPPPGQPKYVQLPASFDDYQDPSRVTSRREDSRSRSSERAHRTHRRFLQR